MAVIVLIHNPAAPPEQANGMHIEGCTAQQAMQMLQNASNAIAQQITAPKVFLPDGRAHVVPPEPKPENQPPATDQEK